MFDAIQNLQSSTGELSIAVAVVGDVRYAVTFYASDDGKICSVTCAVVHGNGDKPVDFSVTTPR